MINKAHRKDIPMAAIILRSLQDGPKGLIRLRMPSARPPCPESCFRTSFNKKNTIV